MEAVTRRPSHLCSRDCSIRSFDGPHKLVSDPLKMACKEGAMDSKVKAIYREVSSLE